MEQRTWRWKKVEGPLFPLGAPDGQGVVVARGQRSDGEFINAQVACRREDLDRTRELLDQAEALLETYRDCACTVGKPCEWHR